MPLWLTMLLDSIEFMIIMDTEVYVIKEDVSRILTKAPSTDCVQIQRSIISYILGLKLFSLMKTAVEPLVTISGINLV